MAVPFNTISQNTAVPLFYAEIDPSAANRAQQNQRTLMIGHKLAAGSALVGVAIPVGNVGLAWQLFGRGSMLADMIEVAVVNDPGADMWAIAVDEPVGAAAAGTVTVTGTASAAGAISLYVAGQRIAVPVAAGDSPSAIATAMAGAVIAAVDAPVSASAAAGVVTLAAKWKGVTGNDIVISENYRGQLGGEVTPPGVALAIVPMAGGAGVPSLAQAVTAMGDEEYDFICLGFADTGSLDALRLEMSDTAGRWSPSRQLYGHVYTALRGTLSSLVAFGQTRNDPHATVVGAEPGVQNPAWQFAAAFTARNAIFLRAHAARPTQTGQLLGILPAPRGKTFIWQERQTLLQYGIAVCSTVNGVVQIDRAITTYRQNAYGVADSSYYDSETLFTAMAVIRRLRGAITKYGRHLLADDGTEYSPGSAIVTPSVLRAELIGEYRAMEYEGLVENAEAFKENLIVERDKNNPCRVNVLLPPDFVNQLRIFAMVVQFRLQY